MHRDPAKRYFDAAEMRRALERFVAKTLKVSEPALLVGFLHQRHRVSDTEALARLSQTEFTAAQQLGALPKEALDPSRRRWPMRLVMTTLTFGAAAWLSWPWWWPMLVARWEHLFP
jgi:serine/threonine-protein kinase